MDNHNDVKQKIVLLPCPFCGSKGEIAYSTHLSRFYYPTCTYYSCPAYVETQDEQGGCAIECNTKEEATGIWNTRVRTIDRVAIVTRIEKLRQQEDEESVFNDQKVSWNNAIDAVIEEIKKGK